MTLAERPVIPAARFAERLQRAAAATAASGLDALLIGVGSDLRYLTGYAAMPLERLTMLVISAGGDPFIVVPRLERGAAEAGLHTPLRIVTWDETDDPHALAVRDLAARRVGVSDTMLAMHLLRLQAVLGPAVECSLASAVLRDLRMIKDADEIALLRLAAQAADRVVGQIAAGSLVGRTEADVAREVRERLVAEGHDESLFAIVGSGPNSASPHHEASDRVIEAGEPIVLDIGGTLGGYGSDITRTLWVTGGDPRPDRTNGSAICSPSSTAPRRLRRGRSGRAWPARRSMPPPRAPIDAEGYGEGFFHRTGHGIGLEGHEDPYLVDGNDLPLRPGMAFSVEPGIYLPGEYGARIEDIVVCGDDGPIVLNEAPRELYVVDG